MSERFGRNQKRKLSEKLAQVRKELNHALHVQANQYNAIQETRKLLGTYFATLPIQTIYGLPGDTDTTLPRNEYTMNSSATSLRCMVDELKLVRYHAGLDKLRGCVVVKVGHGNSTVSVALSTAAVAAMSDELLQEVIAQDVVSPLVKEMKKNV